MNIDIKTGSEGPTHDLYHYDETTIVKGDRWVKWHSGLGMWLERGYVTDKGRHRKFDLHEFTAVANALVNELTCEWVGMTITQALRWKRKAQEARWRAHRGHGGTQTVAGFPGESFEICKCGEVLDDAFDISAVE